MNHSRRMQQQVYESKLTELSDREMMVERTNKTVMEEIQKIRDGKTNEYIRGDDNDITVLLV